MDRGGLNVCLWVVGMYMVIVGDGDFHLVCKFDVVVLCF